MYWNCSNTCQCIPRVRKVDLFTRRIIDKRVSVSYEKEVEVVNEKARIIRIPCGGQIYRAKKKRYGIIWMILFDNPFY